MDNNLYKHGIALPLDPQPRSLSIEEAINLGNNSQLLGDIIKLTIPQRCSSKYRIKPVDLKEFEY